MNQFKKCKVIMLYSKTASENGIMRCITDENRGKLYLAQRQRFGNKVFDVDIESSPIFENFRPYNLYILSSEEDLKENDYCYAEFFDNHLPYFFGKYNEDSKIHLSKEQVIIYKIIASTNKKLHLPRPSTSFVAKYCRKGGEGFKFVNVEFEDDILKVSKDNTISIRKVEEEITPKVEENNKLLQNFNYKELLLFCEKCYKQGMEEGIKKAICISSGRGYEEPLAENDFKKWFEDNIFPCTRKEEKDYWIFIDDNDDRSIVFSLKKGDKVICYNGTVGIIVDKNNGGYYHLKTEIGIETTINNMDIKGFKIN